jgi:hypothetical protein
MPGSPPAPCCSGQHALIAADKQISFYEHLLLLLKDIRRTLRR